MYWCVYIVSDQYIWSVWNTQSDWHTHTVSNIFERIHQIRHIGLTIYTHTQSTQLWIQIHTNTSYMHQYIQNTVHQSVEQCASPMYSCVSDIQWHRFVSFRYIGDTPIYLIYTQNIYIISTYISKTRHMYSSNCVWFPCICVFQLCRKHTNLSNIYIIYT